MKARAKKHLLLLLFATVAFGFAGTAAASVCYDLTMVVPPARGGASISAYGQVAGGADPPTVWNGGNVTYLAVHPSYERTYAEGISPSGSYVTGYAYNTSAPGSRGLLWHDGIMTELQPLPGDVGSTAVNVNDSGVVVGYSLLSGVYENNDMRAVYWLNGEVHELPGLGGVASEALDINNAGVIVGDSMKADGMWTTCRWVNGVPQDLGSLPGYAQSWSRGISSSGLVAVNCWGVEAASPEGAALWDNGTLIPIEPPEYWTTVDYVRSVNSLGQVVGGASATASNGETHTTAMIWEDGISTNLNDLIPFEQSAYYSPSGWWMWQARDINDRGQILLRALSNYNTQVATFLLTPVPILAPELSGGATADVVYDRYGNVGGYAAGLPAGSELVGGTTDLDNFQLTGSYATLILNYDESDLLYRSIAEESLRLYWYNDLLSQWVLAGNDSNLTWNPAAQFVLGAPTDVLGDWGLNMADNYVWANIDHASTYSMGGEARVPEPAALISLVTGLALLGANRVRTVSRANRVLQ